MHLYGEIILRDKKHGRGKYLEQYCNTILLEQLLLTPQLFEDINFLKSNRELWKNSQQTISRAISMSKMKNSSVYKRMEEDETEEKRMNGDYN